MPQKNQPLPEATTGTAIDVEAVMREIRESIHSIEKRKLAFAASPALASARAQLPDLALAGYLAQQLRDEVARLGEMPPRPPTLRARLGVFPVWLVRRALFWYTEQLRELQTRVIRVADEQLEVTRRMLDAQADMQAEIDQLKKALRIVARQETARQEGKQDAAGAGGE